jgi:hypothetical protein
MIWVENITQGNRYVFCYDDYIELNHVNIYSFEPIIFLQTYRKKEHK